MIQAFFAIIGVVFIFLQSRFIFGGDSAEFSTIAKTWGIGHPPGYPLYSLLINIVDKVIPFGTTPWKIAILSSIASVVTGYVIYKILCILKVSPIVSLLSSCLYLVLFPIWQYSLIPEVFALHNLLVALVTYLLLQFEQTKNKSVLLWAFFLIGLCVSHHHIFVLFIPGWFLIIKKDIRKTMQDMRFILRLFFATLLGVSFYIYPVLASSFHTTLDWENAKTIDGLFRLITRSSYGSFKAYAGSQPNIVNQLTDVLSSMLFVLIDFRPLGIVLIITGILLAYKRSKALFAFIIASSLFHVAFLFYTNFRLTNSFASGMFERFLIPLYFLLILSFGIGADQILQQLITLFSYKIKSVFLKKIVYGAYGFSLVFLLLTITITNFKSIALIKKIDTFDVLGRDIIDTLPRNAIFSLQTDTPTFSAMYHVYGLQQRKDIVFLQTGLMSKQNYIHMLKRRTPQLNITSPILSSKEFIAFISHNADRGYFAEQPGAFGYWLPYGVLWKYYPTEEAARKSQEEIIAINHVLWGKYKIPNLTAYEKNIFHLLTVQDFYLSAYVSFSKLLIINEKFTEAKQILKKAVYTYGVNDSTTKLALLNISVITNDCIAAKKDAATMNLSALMDAHPVSAKSIVDYFNTCDPTNPQFTQAIKKQEEYKKSLDLKLDSF